MAPSRPRNRRTYNPNRRIFSPAEIAEFRSNNTVGKKVVDVDAEDHISAESATLPSDSNKRRKTGPSLFHAGYEMALDPSLVRPPTEIEQANNILFVENVGKQYQLEVKDHTISIRDNRIRAKDARIKELEEDAEEMDRELLEIKAQKHELVKYIEDQSAMGGAQAKRIKDLISEVTDVMGKLTTKETQARALQGELKAHRAKVKVLEERRFLDKTLEWACVLLGILPKFDPKATTTRKAFPFMKLPGELRNNVYKQCIVAKRPIDFWPIVALDAPNWTTRRALLEENLKGINVALLRTSNQVHRETVCILYGCNRFRFTYAVGCWTMLEGFLLNLNRNCRYLTNVEIGCPDWLYTRYGDEQEPLELWANREMQPILTRFGLTADNPVGPSLKSSQAYFRASQMMLKLPNLKNFKLIVPYNAQLFQFAIQLIERMLTDKDCVLYPGQKPDSTPKRSVVFCQRAAGWPQVIFGANVDDDMFMKRDPLAVQAINRGMKVQLAAYGTHADRASYIIDNEEEEEYEIHVPIDVEYKGAIGIFEKAKRFIGRLGR